MKNTITAAIILFSSIVLYSCSSTQQVSYQDEQAPVSYQTFYDELSPYGRWIDYPGYGYVWSPAITDFRPYYDNGYWISTNSGWCWNSSYSWGWAPFHYGRWFYETGYGWLWLPGYEWAPAWVVWGNHADYYGWAPLAPGMNIGVSAVVNIPYEHWVFVDHHYINATNFREHCANVRQNETIFRNTTIIKNTNYTSNKTAFSRGPEIKEVQNYTGDKIRTVAIAAHQKVSAPVVDHDRRELRVYKPEVRMPKQQEVMRPKETMPYKDIPHDNGRRGTWAMPEHHPNEMHTGNPPSNGQGNNGRGKRGRGGKG